MFLCKCFIYKVENTFDISQVISERLIKMGLIYRLILAEHSSHVFGMLSTMCGTWGDLFIIGLVLVLTQQNFLLCSLVLMICLTPAAKIASELWLQTPIN